MTSSPDPGEAGAGTQALLPEPLTPVAWEWRATGTVWRIHHDGCVDGELAELVCELVEEDEERWSRFRPSSELSRVNDGAGEPVHVSWETFELLAACAAWRERTGGVFDPLVGTSLHAWGYASSMRDRAPHAATSPPATAVAGRVELDSEHSSVTIAPGARLDLGGIAKGWMADRAAALLRFAEPGGRILVDAGGDLVSARGSHLVAVDGAPGAWITLDEGEAAATSSWRQRSWRNGDGRIAHHLIDPATGAPGAQTSATVVGASATEADVLATVLALRPGWLARVRTPARVDDDGIPRSNHAWNALTGSGGSSGGSSAAAAAAAAPPDDAAGRSPRIGLTRPAATRGYPIVVR